MNRILGIDIGNVVINRWNRKPSDENEEPEMPGAIDSLVLLAQRFGPQNIFFVSSCDDGGARNIRWFNKHQVFERTGIPHSNARFCDSRPLKAEICKELGITDFLDDRIRVLMTMESVARLWNFRPPENENLLTVCELSNLRIVNCWQAFIWAVT